MRVEFANRALADLQKLSTDSRASFGAAVSLELEARIRQVVAHVATNPLAAQRVDERPGVHVVPLIRYPYKILYRVLKDRIRVLHIRHTSRRPWLQKR